jgi:GDP-L-fucose synthase
MYNNTNVLVAGGTGTIGVPLVKELLKRNANVKVVSVESEEQVRLRLGNSVEFQRLDLTDSKNCEKAVKGQEFVFNLVGIKGSVGIGETKVASYFVPMLRFQTNLLEAAFNEKVERFLFVGSVCSYPQAQVHYEENMWNGMPKQNDRIPGIAKRVGELLGEAYQLEYGWDAVRIVRPSNVYGPYDDFNPQTAQVIPALIHRMLSGENPVKIWGDGSAIRDFIYSHDVAYWMCEALEKAPPNYPINLGSGTGITIKEIAVQISTLISPSPSLMWDTTKPTGDPCRLLAMDRAKQVLGYYQRTSLSDGLAETINWYKKQLNL